MEEPGSKWRSYQDGLKREAKAAREKKRKKREAEASAPEPSRPRRVPKAREPRRSAKPSHRLRRAREESAAAWRAFSGGLGRAWRGVLDWLIRQKEIRSPAILILASVAAIALMGLLAAGLLRLPGRGEKAPKMPPSGWTRAQVRALIGNAAIDAWTGPQKLKAGGRTYTVTPTLDADLNPYMRSIIDPQYARWIGFAAMDPETGRILAVAGFSRDGDKEHPVFGHLYPAASVFKIVTATAAVDLAHLTADTQVGFVGNKYTLYKNQVTPDPARQNNQLPLKEAFGESVNPAFGLIGAYVVGPENLRDKACSFGFGRRLDVEVPVATAVCAFPESGDDFGVAQVASGFNRTTLITPIQGAAFVAALVNGGTYLDPSIVDKVTDETGKAVYEGRKKEVGRVCSSETAAEILRMMGETIVMGTARRLFAGYGKDPVLSLLDLGGKTGSMNDGVEHSIRYDWFVGFARQKGGTKALVVASVVAHDKFIGTRAAHYARMAMKRYFANLAPASAPSP